MAAIQGIDQFEEFVDDIDAILGNSRIGGLDKARKDAIKATADDFVTELTRIIKASNTSKGGTFKSSTSPYEPGGENESSGDSLHIQNKNAWNSEVLGSGQVVVYPDPQVWKRAMWMNYGTSDHEPREDTPMYFYSGGVTIVVAEKPDKSDRLDYKRYIRTQDVMSEADARFQYGDIEGAAGEVEGVDGLNFFEKAFKYIVSEQRFEKNMEKEIDKLFEKRGLPLTGSWT